MRAVSERQKQVLRRIFWSQNEGRPPTMRELARLLGIASTNGVNDHLLALERRGLLERLGPKFTARKRLRVTDAGLALIGVSAARPYTLEEWDADDEPDIARIRATIAALEQAQARQSTPEAA